MKQQNFGLIIDELENVLDTLFIYNKNNKQSDVETIEEEKEKKNFKEEKPKREKKETTKETKTKKNTQENTSSDINIFTKKRAVKSKRHKVKVDYISTPKKPTLQHYREWEKAFKPLKITSIDTTKTILDVDKTVDWIAQTDLFQLIYTQKLKKHFSLTLLIDKHHSMDIFQSLVDDFCDTLEHYGVFAKIDYFYLDGKDEETILHKDKHQKVKNSTILREENNLILILSSCISPAWRSNSMYQNIEIWSKTNFCSIVQMLPSNMWLSTSLKQGKKLSWKSTQLYAKNSQLSSQKEFLYFDEDIEILKIPIISFEHRSFKAWSSVVMGNSHYAISGIAIDTRKIKEKKIIQSNQLTSKERLDNFLSQASSTAKILSAYLANNHVSFEIARIIQELKLPDSSFSHLAEVFLGGIIEKKIIDNQVHYDFYEGIREVLKHQIAPIEALELFDQTSRFVSDYFGIAQKFPSMIQNPNSIREIEWDDTMIAFAKIGIDILKRVGGIYYAQALDFESKINTINSITPTTKSFLMGSNERDDEKPVHKVTINYDFEIAQYPVTFEEYDLYCEVQKIDKPDDEAWGRGKRPVINVSWNDAQAYIKWLNEQTGENYRLPTEAEWEYSARAGTTTKWSFGDDEKELEKYAWYNSNDGKRTKEVGTKDSNPWGLHDMHGNVWEWCQDDWVDSYEKTPRDGKAYEDTSLDRKVLRGGSWFNVDSYTRSSNRDRLIPTVSIDNVGFRLLRTLN